MSELARYWNDFQGLFSGALRAIADRLEFFGGYRWAAAIVLLTLVVRTLLLPLAIKQVRSSQAMQRLQPELKKLQQRFANDKPKLQQEMMELYRREGVNPFAGCLPLVAQMPVFISMFYAIRGASQSVKYMPFLGGNLAVQASKSLPGILLLAVMMVSQYFSTKQVMVAQDPAQARLYRVMPIIMVVFMINFPAGLVLYWATSNVYALVQQTIILRSRAAAAQPQKQSGEAAKETQKKSSDGRMNGRTGGKPKSRPPVKTKARNKRR